MRLPAFRFERAFLAATTRRFTAIPISPPACARAFADCWTLLSAGRPASPRERASGSPEERSASTRRRPPKPRVGFPRPSRRPPSTGPTAAGQARGISRSHPRRSGSSRGTGSRVPCPGSPARTRRRGGTSGTTRGRFRSAAVFRRASARERPPRGPQEARRRWIPRSFLSSGGRRYLTQRQGAGKSGGSLPAGPGLLPAVAFGDEAHLEAVGRGGRKEAVEAAQLARLAGEPGAEGDACGLGRSVDFHIREPHIDDLVCREVPTQRRGDVGGSLSFGVAVVPRQVLDDGSGVSRLCRFHDAVDSSADRVAPVAAGECRQEENQEESRSRFHKISILPRWPA